MKQTGSMDELVGTFVELISYLPNVPEETTMNTLLAALQSKIRMEVVWSRPLTVEGLFDCANEAEDFLQAFDKKEERCPHRTF